MATIVLEANEEFAHTHTGISRSQCLDGTVRMAYAGFEQILGPGDAVTVPAGVEHVMTNIGARPAHVDCAHSPRRSATTPGTS